MKLVAAEHVANEHVPGWILTERAEVTGNDKSEETNAKKPSLSLDLWAANLRALLAAYEKEKSGGAESLAPNTPPPARRGKGGLRGTAPSPVRRHLVPY